MSTATDPPLRLTRRGRVAVAVTSVALVVLLLGLSGLDSSARPAPPAGATAPAAADGVRDAEPAPVARQKPRPVAEQLVSQAGTGTLTVVPGAAGPTDDAGRLVRYRVRVEQGLQVDGQPVDHREFARIVHRILTDDRGWQPIDGVRFVRVDGDDSDVDVVLASPDTTDAMCAPLGTGGWLSCYNGYATVLNARRWFSGAESYGNDLVNYRRYLVSHEMGHHLGHSHVECPAPGATAPVMVQQTKSLYGCAKGPWPATG